MMKKQQSNQGFSLLELLIVLLIMCSLIIAMFTVAGKMTLYDQDTQFISLFLGEAHPNFENYSNDNMVLNFKTIQSNAPLAAQALKQEMTSSLTQDDMNIFPTMVGGLSVLAKQDDKKQTHYTIKYDGVEQQACEGMIRKVIQSRQNANGNNPNQLYKYDTIVNQVEFEPVALAQSTHDNGSEICKPKNNTLSISN